MTKFSELRQRLTALRTEGTALLDKADTEAEGVLSEDQAGRMVAIKAEIAGLETDIDATVTALETEAATAAGEFERGVAAGWAGAVAAVEVCAVANVPATRVLGFVKDKTSADDVRKAVLSERADGKELNTHHSTANADKPASWDKAIARANARVK